LLYYNLRCAASVIEIPPSLSLYNFSFASYRTHLTVITLYPLFHIRITHRSFFLSFTHSRSLRPTHFSFVVR